MVSSGRGSVSIGLIGCGLWGRAILRDLSTLGCHVFIVEPDPENRLAAEKLSLGAIYESLSRLPSVDGAIVATPASTHGNVVEELLGRRIPIFCEKPLTTDVGSATRLAKLAEGRLFVMHVWRYHRGVERLCEIAQSNELGRVLSLRTERKNWTSPRTDVDSIWTLVPHDLTIALAIFGEIPAPQSASVEIIDGAAVSLMAILGKKPFVALDCSTRFGEKRREIRLHCEGGVAVLPNPDSPFLEVLRSSKPPDSYPISDRQTLAGEPALLAELRVFVGYLRGGPPPPTDANEGVAVVQAITMLRALAGL